MLEFANLVLPQKAKQEASMFDVYSQCSAHTRSVGFSHPETLPTWPEMVRQNRDTEIEMRLFKVFSESPLSLFVANLAVHFQRWQQNLGRQPVKQPRVYRHYLPLKRHSTVQR